MKSLVAVILMILVSQAGAILEVYEVKVQEFRELAKDRYVITFTALEDKTVPRLRKGEIYQVHLRHHLKGFTEGIQAPKRWPIETYRQAVAQLRKELGKSKTLRFVGFPPFQPLDQKKYPGQFVTESLSFHTGIEGPEVTLVRFIHQSS